MLKGCQRDLIVLHTTDSPLFEDAFFVLRTMSAPPNDTDMLAEAGRIISSGDTFFKRRKRKKRFRISPLLAYLVGVATGALALFLPFFGR